jgi:hypothetical protein
VKLHDVKLPLSGYRLQARSANTEEISCGALETAGRVYRRSSPDSRAPVFRPFILAPAGRHSERAWQAAMLVLI